MARHAKVKALWFRWLEVIVFTTALILVGLTIYLGWPRLIILGLPAVLLLRSWWAEVRGLRAANRAAQQKG